MSQPTRRAALLLTGVASASLAVLGLAPRTAHAQYVGGMAMPQAMLPPGFGSGAPAGGMSSGAGGWNATGRGLSFPSALPTRTLPAWPSAVPGGMYSGRSYRPSFGQSYTSFFPRFSRGVTPEAPTQPLSSAAQADIRRSGASVGWYGSDAPARAAVPQSPAPFRPNPIVTRHTAPVRGELRAMSTVSQPSSAHTTNNYIYAPQTSVTVVGGPSLLGGFYYGNYCDTSYGVNTYPSVYSTYTSFPPYIYNPGVVYQNLSQPVYLTEPQPFNPPQYQVTYNEDNYYVVNAEKASDIEAGGAQADKAVKQAYPADSYQAAFADIERAWTDGNLDLLKNHLRGTDTKVSVFLHSQYKYSLNTSDFTQITRDAFGRLNTVSFQFTRLRTAKDGDVTAYGKHVYRAAVEADKPAKDSAAAPDGTVAFDSAAPADTGGDQTSRLGTEKTVYVSYTLRHDDDGWYITAVDSSPDPLVKEAK